MSRRAAPKVNSPAIGSEPHIVGERGGHMSAAPNRFKQAKAPSGGSEPHTVGERGGHV